MKELEKIDEIKKAIDRVYRIETEKYIQKNGQEPTDEIVVTDLSMTKTVLKNETIRLILDTYFGTDWEKLFDTSIEELKLTGFLKDNKLTKEFNVISPTKKQIDKNKV